MILTQSITKALEQSCPRKVYNEYIDGNQRPNKDMEKGSFFETICLGSGAKGVITTDLERLKNGAKSADQERIEKQAQRFLDMFNPSHKDWNGRIITDKQLDVEVGTRKGTIDFVTEGIIWDLKLTGDMDGYWADAQKVDLLQQVHYQWLYKQKFGIEMDSRLLIFDYSTRMRIKEVKINISPEATFSALQRFDRIEEAISDWDSLEEWPRIPSEHDCSKCSLSCEKRVFKDNIIYQEVYL